jgi:hypothetical protein
MPAVDVTTVLRKALRELESQKSRLDGQIAALHAALDGDAPSTSPTKNISTPSRRRRRMSPAARRAVGLRMKAYWAKRRAAATKTKAGPSTRRKTRRPSRKKK